LSVGISVLALLTNRQYSTAGSVTYAETTSLRISGAGAITSQSGGGMWGGGFGMVGAAKGVLMASIFNTLTARTHTTIETTIELIAGARGILILNDVVTPDVLKLRLAPVFARLGEAKRGIDAGHMRGGDPISRIEQLAALRDKGLVSNDEFEKSKRALLDSMSGKPS
jgi:hypothetical protein